jgi:hypothetical protein
MNTVYDWPFDAAHALGAENIDVLDINGQPHVELCDPGIYPSFFIDHGRPAGQAAFQHIFRKYIVDGAADGVYVPPLPAHCPRHTHCSIRLLFVDSGTLTASTRTL